MVFMRSEKSFSERELTTFKQLFGIEQSGPDFGEIFDAENMAVNLKRRETFGEADSEHNDAMLNKMMPIGK